MVVINFKNKFLIILFIFLSGINASLFAAYNSPKNPNIANIVEDAYQKLGLKSSSMDFARTQTLSYLNRPGLRKHLDTYQFNINTIGHEFFKELFAKIISREMDYKDKFYVFYHGQKREFMLIQDLYKGLYEFMYKKAFMDFVMLRVPDNDFSKFKSVTAFLKKNTESGEINNWDFDERDDIKKLLLAVNPSLFGNSYNADAGECTFFYFLNSNNASSLNTLSLIKNVFDCFNLTDCFEMHRNEIEELSNLLADYEGNKTGLLLQIFVPKALVNQIAYRCRPWGLMYHNDKKPEENCASVDLDEYKAGSVFLDDNSFDSTQFRLLMNKSMLDPTSGIKIFRYCNQTPKFDAYGTKLKELLNKIGQEYQEVSN